MKHPIIAASILALAAASPAFAQTPDTNAAPPAKIEKMDKSDQTNRSIEQAPAAGTRAAAPASETMADKTASLSDWRASNLIGSTIVNAANESIGDINDLLVSSDGKVSSVVVGVGGFLGIGEKNVALPFGELSFTKNENGKTVVMSKVTKETLDSMPEWKAPPKR